MQIRYSCALFFVAILVPNAAGANPSNVLVQDPFQQGYNNWIDTFTSTPVINGPPGWRYHFENGTLMEPSDGRAGDGSTNAGDYTPYILLQDGFVSPETYDVDARFYTSDNDGLGVVFGWQDINNYHRLSLRHQENGNLGFTRGVSVQRVTNGVVTQISPDGTGVGNTSVPTAGMINNREPLDVILSVDGNNWSVTAPGFNNDNPLISGTDPQLGAGKLGVLSWAQRRRDNDPQRPAWGTELDYLTVSDSTGSPLFVEEFDNVSPVAWRPLQMNDSFGNRLDQDPDKESLGNLGLQFTTGTINDSSNGFGYATTAAPNIDFLTPSIVVDEPGSEGFTDYEMRVRMQNDDDDGIGTLLRVQDDDTFYRVMFTRQRMLPPNVSGQFHQRPPQGLSVQKSQDGVWTELFRDDQSNPLFVFQEGVPFDVTIKAEQNSLVLEVLNDPDGAAQLIEYPEIIDSNDPLLWGTVGLATWGNGLDGDGAIWSAYGGQAGLPMLTSISTVPEPSAIALLCVALLALPWRQGSTSR
ncbi:hypothetical protein [Aeoliella sp.]|uniref:hypothetical protein n=1 Tax=Aeoliella sp. TaxID=2795800 RepID=UPI003CCC3E96